MPFDYQFYDGFDTYGPPGFLAVDGGVAADNCAILSGEWTQVAAYVDGSALGNFSAQVVDALSGFGRGLKISVGSTLYPAALSKTLPTSFPRIVCGGTFQSPVDGLHLQAIVFGDAGNDQLAITIEPSGQIGWRRGATLSAGGAMRGGLEAISDESVSRLTSFVLECAVVFHGSAGKLAVWINGKITSLNLTGLNTRFTGNSNANQVRIAATASSYLLVDHFYVRGYADAASTDTPILHNPVVETSFPNVDHSVNFSFGAAILGPDYSATPSVNAPGANELWLRKFTPDTDGTLETVNLIPAASSGGAKFKAVVYADAAGAPATLLSDGTEEVGAVSGVVLTSSLNTPQSLTAGVPIWLGFLGDTSVVLALSDDGHDGHKAARTYAGGAPGTAPSMVATQPNWVIWGDVTGVTADFWAVLDNWANSGDRSYLTSAILNAQDLFEFPDLLTTPTTIYGVKLAAVAKLVGGGARGVNMVVVSGATTGYGDQTDLTLSGTYASISSYFEVDPDTAAAWNASGVNLLFGGYKISL